MKPSPSVAGKINTTVEHQGVQIYDGFGSREDSKSLTVVSRVRSAVITEVSLHIRSKRHKFEKPRWTMQVENPVSGHTIECIALNFDPSREPVLLIYCMHSTAREKYDKWQLTCLGPVPTDESYEEFTGVGLVDIARIGDSERFNNQSHIRSRIIDLRETLGSQGQYGWCK